MVAEPILVKTRPSRIGERTAHERGILAEKREVEDRLLEPRDGHPTLSKGVHEAVGVIVVGHAAGKPPGGHAREEVVLLQLAARPCDAPRYVRGRQEELRPLARLADLDGPDLPRLVARVPEQASMSTPQVTKHTRRPQGEPPKNSLVRIATSSPSALRSSSHVPAPTRFRSTPVRRSVWDRRARQAWGPLPSRLGSQRRFVLRISSSMGMLSLAYSSASSRNSADT